MLCLILLFRKQDTILEMKFISFFLIINILFAFRHFKIALPFLVAIVVLALIYVGRITFEKAKENWYKIKNQVQDINNDIDSTEEEQPVVQHNGLNNSSHNPQIISTLALTFTLTICLVIASTLYINIFLRNFAITKAMKLGLHRILISFTIPLFFYCKNSSLRRFVYEMYFSHCGL